VRKTSRSPPRASSTASTSAAHLPENRRLRPLRPLRAEFTWEATDKAATLAEQAGIAAAARSNPHLGSFRNSKGPSARRVPCCLKAASSWPVNRRAPCIPLPIFSMCASMMCTSTKSMVHSSGRERISGAPLYRGCRSVFGQSRTYQPPICAARREWIDPAPHRLRSRIGPAAPRWPCASR